MCVHYVLSTTISVDTGIQHRSQKNNRTTIEKNKNGDFSWELVCRSLNEKKTIKNILVLKKL